ncbi:MAG TPA: hypothetical protein VLE91_02390, partial [Candidatus Saccharimonadales bacterium]|nr:hypothetical protein [Candidatus Saccharimonadales bacterium]
MNKPISNLRDFKNAQMRRNFLEKELKTNLQSINSQLITDDLVEGKNIENLIGATQIPLGVAGPITINHHPRATSHYLPLATTEGALVASISRGAKAVTEASGATVVIHSSGITRGPVFKSNGVEHSQKAKEIITKNFQSLAKTAAKTSSHLKLKNIKIRFVGKNLYCRFSFDTQDAMGMNMATFASEEIARQIEKLTKVELVALAGNFDIDKKPSFLNFLSGRGKQAWADIIIPKKIVQSTLKTTPEKIVEIVKRK